MTANDSLVSAPAGLPTWINVGGNTDIAAGLNHEVYRSADKWSFVLRCSKNVYRRDGSIDFVLLVLKVYSHVLLLMFECMLHL